MAGPNLAAVLQPALTGIAVILPAVLSVGIALVMLYVTSSGARKVVQAVRGGFGRGLAGMKRSGQEQKFKVRARREAERAQYRAWKKRRSL